MLIAVSILLRSNFLPGVFVPVIIALVIVVIVLGHLRRLRRRKALQAFAAQHGLSFDHSKNRHVDNEFPALKCFHQGHSRYGCNFLKGVWSDRRFLAFDYHYTTGSGKNQSRHSFTCVMLGTTVPLKELFIRPEGFFDKVTEFFGYDDIDFESAEFSRRFYVKASDKRWAYDVLHARAIEFLLNQPKFTIRFTIDCAMARKGRIFKLEEYAQAANVLQGLLEGLPEYVLQQQGAKI